MLAKTRALAALVLATVCAAVLTGCGNANAASGAGAEFERYMQGQTGVLDVYAGGANTSRSSEASRGV